MQPSMFNVRVPLEERGDVFLMNTFTDAQLMVAATSRTCSTGSSGRVRAGRRTTSARRSPRWRSTASSSTAATPSAGARSLLQRRAREPRPAARHGADDAAVQFRLRLLHPGGSRRLQQARREDVAGDRGARRRVGGSAARRAAPDELRADVLRRRAAAEPAGRCTTSPSGCWRRCQARGVEMSINVITNGLLLTPEVVDRLLPLRPERRQDHARRRPRHAQPDAAAARRPGHVRPDRRRTSGRSPGRCRISIGGNFDERSVDSYPALLDFLRRAGVRRHSSPRWRSSR